MFSNQSTNTTANWTIGVSGPTGNFSASMGGINSTTFANGFALFDSDANGTTNSIHNAFLTTSDSINLEGRTHVWLKIQSYYRKYNCKVFVGVSQNKTTWDEIELHQNLELNEASANAERLTINISKLIENKSYIWIRFRFNGNDDYAWMIDDLSLEDAPQNELQISKAHLTYYGKKGMILTQIPLPLANQTQIGHSFVINNNGSTLQTGIVASGNIQQGNTIFNSATVIVSDTLLSSLSDTFSFSPNPPFIPNGLGNYTYRMMVNQFENDIDTTNNFKTHNFSVGDSVLAMDRNLLNAPRFGTTFFSEGNFNGTGLGLKYVMADSCRISSASIFVHNDAEIGSGMIIKAYYLENDTLKELGRTNSFSVTQQDKNTWRHLYFQEGPIFVEAQTVIYLIAEWIGFPKVFYTKSEKNELLSDSSSFINRVIGLNKGLSYLPFKNIPYLRLNIRNKTVSLEENQAFKPILIFPNPSNSALFIKSSVIGELKIISTTGKIIHNQIISLGEHKIEISDWPAGIYFIQIQSGNKLNSNKWIKIN